MFYKRLALSASDPGPAVRAGPSLARCAVFTLKLQPRMSEKYAMQPFLSRAKQLHLDKAGVLDLSFTNRAEIRSLGGGVVFDFSLTDANGHIPSMAAVHKAFSEVRRCNMLQRCLQLCTI